MFRTQVIHRGGGTSMMAFWSNRVIILYGQARNCRGGPSGTPGIGADHL